MSDKMTILLSGSPGIGKTTLVQKIYKALQNSLALPVRGFYTLEVRNENLAAPSRIGFDVVTLDGNRAILARDATNCPDENVSRPKVGKYYVFVHEFEVLALPLLSMNNKTENGLLIIDEIGKMELMSKKFENALKEMSNCVHILATIPSQTRHATSIVEIFRNSPKSIVFEITKNNRNQMEKIIIENVNEMFKK